jgi:hypothetical protein
LPTPAPGQAAFGRCLGLSPSKLEAHTGTAPARQNGSSEAPVAGWGGSAAAAAAARYPEGDVPVFMMIAGMTTMTAIAGIVGHHGDDRRFGRPPVSRRSIESCPAAAVRS